MVRTSHVYTIALVAEILGVDEEYLDEISLGMDPEDGRLWLLGPGDEETVIFTELGIDYLRQLMADGKPD